MNGSISTFEDLIAPVTADLFFSENWERKPLHIRRSNSRFYEKLLTNQDIEAVISSGGLRHPSINLAKGGKFYPAEAFTKNIRSGNDLFTGIPDLDIIRSEYRSGATISLPGFQRAWKPIRELTANLESHFDHAAHANVYITPGNAEGFSPHYDTHEVFIIQVAGVKHWRIYEPPLTLPHRTQPFTPRGYTLPATPILELELSPGDLLYLPRGYVHATSTSETYSAHLTLGVTVYTWIDLAAELLQSCKNDIRFRKALPRGFASHIEAKELLKSGISEIFDVLPSLIDYEQALEKFSHRVRANNSKTERPFMSDFKVTESNKDSNMKQRTLPK